MAFESQARAQSDLEDVIKGTDHLRDIRRQYEQLASNMRKAQTQSSRDSAPRPPAPPGAAPPDARARARAQTSGGRTG